VKNSPTLAGMLDIDAQLREQQRAAMVEGFRQSAAMMACTSIVAAMAREGELEAVNVTAVAKKSVAMANALVNELFSDGDGG
jgi:hypothetical protein